MLQVQSPLNESEEALVKRVMDVGFAVHRVLGPGFREKIYQRAFCLELDARGFSFDCEKRIDVQYSTGAFPDKLSISLLRALCSWSSRQCPNCAPFIDVRCCLI